MAVTVTTEKGVRHVGDRWIPLVDEGHGERAVTAPSLLKRAGHHEVSILAGGARDWTKATGRTLDTRR